MNLKNYIIPKSLSLSENYIIGSRIGNYPGHYITWFQLIGGPPYSYVNSLVISFLFPDLT